MVLAFTTIVTAFSGSSESSETSLSRRGFSGYLGDHYTCEDASALGLGDSDCYHNDRHGNSTRAAVAVARAYREQGFPAGWLLVNDGYGCGCARRREPLSLSLSRRV